MPRSSDQHKVRLSEVMVLYALMNGIHVLSLGHLVLYNVWETREKQDKKQIPFARLLSKVLKKAKVIPAGVRGSKTIHIPLSIKSVIKDSDWDYELTKKEHVLSLLSLRRSLKAPRSDPEDEDEEEEEGGAEEGGAPSQPWAPQVMGFSPDMYGSPYYTHLQQSIEAAGPGTFSNWPEGTQIMFDRHT